MRNKSVVFAAILLASCKDLFSIICIYFSLGERPEKTEVSSVWLDYLSSPKGNLWRETRFIPLSNGVEG
jgi:hypothetical protein